MVEGRRRRTRRKKNCERVRGRKGSGLLGSPPDTETVVVGRLGHVSYDLSTDQEVGIPRNRGVIRCTAPAWGHRVQVDSGASRRRGCCFAACRRSGATFVQRAEAGERVKPRFCRREVEGYLRCGILGHGFARVHCAACKKDRVVAFSCKGRGFCQSCGTRRMVDKQAWLVDRVTPQVPVRQWVLSLPYRVRHLCAHDAYVCAALRRILLRAVSGY